MAPIQNPLLDWVEEPFRFAVLKRRLKYKSKIKYLDIGCGNHSARLSCKYLHNVEYWGIDNGNYNNDSEDFDFMYKFINQDLEKSDLSEVPDAYFDVIVLSHVIEHLRNYRAVLSIVLNKLNEGGILFIETPTVESTRFPSKDGTLNFFDDSTHINPVPLDDVKQLLESHNYKIIANGVRKFKRRILLFPLLLLYSMYQYGSIIGPVLWDIYGFSWYLVAASSFSI
jgi:cyclopropane fatty-acyl-phospholipid synthase-like methyltransferase